MTVVQPSWRGKAEPGDGGDKFLAVPSTPLNRGSCHMSPLQHPCHREGALEALICLVARHNIIIWSFNDLRTGCFSHQFLCLRSPDSATGCSSSVFPLTLCLFACPWLLRSLVESLIDPSRWHSQPGIVIW